jgi:hypothetical protein
MASEGLLLYKQHKSLSDDSKYIGLEEKTPKIQLGDQELATARNA